MGKKIVVTGGAGFIGSNLVDALIDDPRVDKVLVIDNLSNGYYENIVHLEGHPKFQFSNSDIRDYHKVLELTKGYDLISHQAALGSVPRSISDPMTSSAVNIEGTLNVLHASVTNRIERVVLACSSSTYGDSKALPKVEDVIGSPLSPYAVTKVVAELYADVFHKVYGLDYIGLRYFNVFGPRQSPTNPYAAVIPLFCQAMLHDKPPIINGDGETSRDFTYVSNAVQANLKALFVEDSSAINQVYNVACGERTSLNDLVAMINDALSKDLKPEYRPERAGDVRHSLADIDKIKRNLGYLPEVNVKEGVVRVLEWYEKKVMP